MNGPHLVPSMPFSLAFPSRSLGSSLPKAVPLFGPENIKSKHQGTAVAMSSRKQTLDEGVTKQGIPRTSPNLKNTFVVYLPSDVSPTHSYNNYLLIPHNVSHTVLVTGTH